MTAAPEKELDKDPEVWNSIDVPELGMYNVLGETETCFKSFM